MSRPFVIATCDAAAEVLKEAGTFDHIVTVTDQLHEGPCPPDDDIEAFFANRRRVMAATLESHERDTRPGAYGRGWLGKLADCRYANRIEIWADPNPAAQLRLLLVLHALGWLRVGLDGIHIVHATQDIGELQADQVGRLNRLCQPLNDRQRLLAETAWTAFRKPTPEAWAALKSQSLSALPFLGAAIDRLLDELPSALGGATRTERDVLASIAGEETHPFKVLAACADKSANRLLDYWALGRTLDALGRSAAPLIMGLTEGPFDLDLHDAPVKLAAYKSSRLHLTKLGRSVLDGRDDLARLIPIDRWWGGTHLTNTSLWRWDADARRLIPPPGHKR